MHTPEQARETWCPMVRLKLPHNNYNRYEVDPHLDSVVPRDCKCIADKCAMWRWVSSSRQIVTDTQPDEIRVLSKTGYCGLTGQPHLV